MDREPTKAPNGEITKARVISWHKAEVKRYEGLLAHEREMKPLAGAGYFARMAERKVEELEAAVAFHKAAQRL